MFRDNNFLPDVTIKAIITEGVSIMVTLEDEDNNTGSKLFKWDGLNSYDFWDMIEFKGESYNIHVDQDEYWAVAIYDSERVYEKNNSSHLQVDMATGIGIDEISDPDLMRVLYTCHISGKNVTHEGKGDGIREYDMCCECDEKTHPDYMVTLPEEDDRMEICEKCNEQEVMEKLVNKMGEENKSGSIDSNLTDAVLEKIQEDIANGDLTAIDELLGFVPKENLIAYLPEDQWGDHK